MRRYTIRWVRGLTREDARPELESSSQPGRKLVVRLVEQRGEFRARRLSLLRLPRGKAGTHVRRYTVGPRAPSGPPGRGHRGHGGVNGRLLDAVEVVDRLSVPVSWVRESARSGATPCVRLGRYVRFDLADVEAWLEDCRRPGRPVVLRSGRSGRRV